MNFNCLITLYNFVKYLCLLWKSMSIEGVKKEEEGTGRDRLGQKRPYLVFLGVFRGKREVPLKRA